VVRRAALAGTGIGVAFGFVLGALASFGGARFSHSGDFVLGHMLTWPLYGGALGLIAGTILGLAFGWLYARTETF